jgi:hypothetical protein
LGATHSARCGRILRQPSDKKDYIMKKLLRYLPVLLILVLAGCGEESEEQNEEEPPPPPPPSAEQLRTEAMNQLQETIMQREGNLEQRVADQMNQIKSKLRVEENGDRALSIIKTDVLQNMKAAKEIKQWRLALAYSKALETLDPEDTRIEREREEILLYMSRPRLDLRGFATNPDTGETMAIIWATHRNTGEIEKLEVLEGEEFLDYEFVEVVGDRKGIKVEFKPTDEEITIMR